MTRKRRQLTIRKLALFEHLAETLAEFQVALVLGAFDKLFELIRAGLLLLGGLLLVHGLRLVWLSLVRLGLVWLLKKADCGIFGIKRRATTASYIMC